MSEKLNYIDIIKKKHNLKEDKEVAKYLNVKPDTLSQWKGRKKIPYREIIEYSILHNVSLDYILLGKETNYIENRSNLIEIQYFEDTYASAGGGAINYADAPTVMAFDIEFLKVKLGITSFKNLHIINAIGDSMYPTIKTGELLFVNPFKNEDNKIRNKDIYIINTLQGILVKRIRLEHPTKSIITLVSDNPSDPDIKLVGEEINSCEIIGRVVGHFDGL